MSEDYDYLFKCVAVGDGGCGKTAIVVRFAQGFFQEQYKLTIGVEFAIKSIEIKGHKVKLQIWDTGGQERFQYVRPLYYKGAMGAIVVFDLTNRESFDHVPKWLDEIRTNTGDVPMLLVGNKSDLTAERKVPREEAEKFAKDFDMFYVESSAKTGIGIGDVFAFLALLMIGEEIPQDMLSGMVPLPATSVSPKPNVPESKPVPSSITPAPSASKPASPVHAMPSPSFTPKPVASTPAMPSPTFTPKPVAPTPAMPSPSFTPKPVASTPAMPSPTFTPKPVASTPAMPSPTFTPKPVASTPAMPSPTFTPKPVASTPISSHQQPMAPGEQKASFTGKAINLSQQKEPDWYAPSVPKRPEQSEGSVIESAPVIKYESKEPEIIKKENEPVSSIPQGFIPSTMKETLSAQKIPSFSPETSHSMASQVSPPVASLNNPSNIANNPFLSPTRPTAMPSPAPSPSSVSSTSSKSFNTLSPTPAPEQKTPPSPEPDTKKSSRFSGFLSALRGQKNAEPADQKKVNSGFYSMFGSQVNPMEQKSATPIPSAPTSQGNFSPSPTSKPSNSANPFVFGSGTSSAPKPTTSSFGSTPTQINCPQCGAVLNRSFKFCNKCGYRVA